MLGTEKLEKKIRRLSWIGQRPSEEDVASKNIVVVVDSGSWTIHAPKELVWEVIRSSETEVIRNPFLRIDKHDHVAGNKEGNATAEKTFTAEPSVTASCRGSCKLRNIAYQGYRDKQQALENKRLSQRAKDANGSPSPKSTEEQDLERLMTGTHATHEQWAATYSSPPKGKGQRWVGGDSATTYHTLSADSDDTCTYWIEEHITYRPSGGRGTGPGVVPPGLWEKTLRGMAEAIKGDAEKVYAVKVSEGKFDDARKKEKAVPGSSDALAT
ncbi:hypothetical protein BDY19DRAFT_929456 [Irpex rosettiformis]|uniref:Uncharacterized protein n=1 Tax=Irpex rosettiformis TaxID=378272 RepID=A0ACB8UF74_9APHY|nr:hypothetical protein BDY19DRAFT_929456 [Irpex rosettiformis]